MVAFFIPYTSLAQHAPFWGRQTANPNFCEEDYIITPYIAEFINTLTNINYILFAFYGLSKTRNHPDASSLSLSYYGLLAVGVCSFVFHATMKSQAQNGDMLAMLLATAFVLHRVLTFDAPKPARRRISWGITFGLIAVSALHCYIMSLEFHSAVFAAMVAVVGYKTRGLIRKIKDSRQRSNAKLLSKIGSLCCGIGYTLWLIDFFACPTLQTIRSQIGLPWGFLFEFHGWWHIFTGIGAYIFIILVESLTTTTKSTNGTHHQLTYKYAWPVSILWDHNAAGGGGGGGKAKGG